MLMQDAGRNTIFAYLIPAAAQSVDGYTGLMLAQTVAHTDGQTRRILKYRYH